MDVELEDLITAATAVLHMLAILLVFIPCATKYELMHDCCLESFCKSVNFTEVITAFLNTHFFKCGEKLFFFIFGKSISHV